MNSSWLKIALRPDQTIREAVACIDAGGQKIALVLDGGRRLLGTVSDGDVRRGILRNVKLDGPVEEIMMHTPHTVSPSTPPTDVLHTMERYGLDVIPVVDEAGVLLGIEHRDPKRSVRAYDNTVVIMAGGEGLRLRPLTETVPKPMLTVGGMPILEGIVRRLMFLGFSNFVLSVRYLGGKIREHFGDGSRFGCRIRYVEETHPLGTGGALQLLEDRPYAPILVLNGDLLTTLRFDWMLEYHLSHRASATVAVRDYDIPIPFGVVEVENGEVARLTEKPTHRFLVNAGIYVIDPGVIGSIEKGERIDMPSLIVRVMDRGGSVPVFLVREEWIDIGRPQDFDRAEEYIHKMIASGTIRLRAE